MQKESLRFDVAALFVATHPAHRAFEKKIGTNETDKIPTQNWIQQWLQLMRNQVHIRMATNKLFFDWLYLKVRFECIFESFCGYFAHSPIFVNHFYIHVCVCSMFVASILLRHNRSPILVPSFGAQRANADCVPNGCCRQLRDAWDASCIGFSFIPVYRNWTKRFSINLTIQLKLF